MSIRDFLNGIKWNIHCVFSPIIFVSCQYKKATVNFNIEPFTVKALSNVIIEINNRTCYPQASYLVGVALRERGIVVIVVAAGGEAERERGCKEQQ